MAKAATTTPAAAAADARRQMALAGLGTAADGVSITVAAPAERLSLRAPAEALPALSKALGVALPQKAKTSAVTRGRATTAGSRAALWLGPDEWLVIDDAGGDPLADCATVEALHAAVGISHRNVGLVVSGPAAARCLNAGCPQDLSLAAFPVGAASRTVLGKAEIVLWRTETESFRVEAWRSFSDYVYTFLSEAARDAAGA